MQRYTLTVVVLLILFCAHQATAEEQCIQLVQEPATYNKVDQVYQTGPDTRYEITLPVYETEIRKIMVAEAHCPTDTFKTEQISIITTPTHIDYKITPARYEPNYIQQFTKPTSEGWVLTGPWSIAYIVQPEEFTVVEIKRLKAPEQLREINVAEKRISIEIKRVIQPATECDSSELTEPEYLTLEIQHLVTPAKVVQIAIPAEHKTIRQTVLKKGSSIIAKPASCDTKGAMPEHAIQLPKEHHPGEELIYRVHKSRPTRGETTGRTRGEWISPKLADTDEPRAMPPMATSSGGGSGAVHKFMFPLEPLPWPPPAGSWLFPIPRLPFESAAVMTDVESILAPALREAGYVNQRYYLIENNTGGGPGFAIVTQLEKWIGDGLPDPQNRFISAGKERFSLTDYIRNLFFAPEGTYRLILILITDQTWTWDVREESTMTSAKAKKWLFGGGNNLPDAFQKIAFTPRHRVEVAIYEFRREGELIAIEIPGGLTTAKNHFQNSGIQAGLKLPDE